MATSEDTENNFSKATNALHSFWAPFLLLHLGGPDTITAYSLEDNELRSRHFFGFLVNVGLAIYVLWRYWSEYGVSYLAIPVLVLGIVKYGERIWVLRSANIKNFRESLLADGEPGPDYAKYAETDENRENLKLFPYFHQHKLKYFERNYLYLAYDLFDIFKHLFADLILGYYERTVTHFIIRDKSPKYVFKLVSIELGFMYDVFYTKFYILRFTRWGRFRHLLNIFLFTIILFNFRVIIDKNVYRAVDINVTYCLLVGTTAIEIYTFVMYIFSDWGTFLVVAPGVIAPLDSKKRWSGSMSQFSLISFCLKDKRSKRFGVDRMLFCINKELEKHYYQNRREIKDDLLACIYAHLFAKSEKIEGDLFDTKLCKELLAHRGDYAVDKRGLLDKFRWCTVDVEFDDSLLLWHIATDLCYHNEISSRKSPNITNAKCDISKCLSDYMLYLLVMCPSMLPKGIGEIRYRDTCAEVIRYFNQRASMISSNKSEAYKKLLEIDTGPLLEEVKRECISQSVLFFACRLAKQLQALESEEWWSDEEKWEMISEVWVEMLAYASSHCG